MSKRFETLVLALTQHPRQEFLNLLNKSFFNSSPLLLWSQQVPWSRTIVVFLRPAYKSTSRLASLETRGKEGNCDRWCLGGQVCSNKGGPVNVKIPFCNVVDFAAARATAKRKSSRSCRKSSFGIRDYNLYRGSYEARGLCRLWVYTKTTGRTIMGARQLREGENEGVGGGRESDSMEFRKEIFIMNT